MRKNYWKETALICVMLLSCVCVFSNDKMETQFNILSAAITKQAKQYNDPIKEDAAFIAIDILKYVKDNFSGSDKITEKSVMELTAYIKDTVNKSGRGTTGTTYTSPSEKEWKTLIDTAKSICIGAVKAATNLNCETREYVRSVIFIFALSEIGLNFACMEKVMEYHLYDKNDIDNYNQLRRLLVIVGIISAGIQTLIITT